MQLGGHLVKAIAWMGGTLLSFTVMAISVRELSSGMHAFEMLFIRSAIGVVILTVILWATGWQVLRTRRIAGHLFRNAVHFTGQVLWIFGITLLPLATVSAIEFTTPVWGAILAVAFLGERMNRGRWVALALGFAGILVVFGIGWLNKLQIDDCVGAFPVHGLCGIWGTLAVGLFGQASFGAPQNGLFYGGGVSQLGVQCLGIIACLGFTAVAMWLIFRAIDASVGLRVSQDAEHKGLDLEEHGMESYSGFQIFTTE